jgi:hypothetical protein
MVATIGDLLKGKIVSCECEECGERNKYAITVL